MVDSLISFFADFVAGRQTFDMNLLMRRTERVQEKLETIVQLERLSRTPFEVTREHFTCSICYEIFNNAAK
ncbi:hypothetical protein OSTOST_12646 [Ostertagia ostertagi]